MFAVFIRFVGNLSRLTAVCKIIRRERLIILHGAPHTLMLFFAFDVIGEFDAFHFLLCAVLRGFRPLRRATKGRCPLDSSSL